MNDQQQAVAAEPRLFVGQCGDATADQLTGLFGPFAARGLRALHILRKGCAMVLYERWAEAEAAQEAHNGRTRLNGGRPLVVTFANPKRIRQGESPEPAIAPRKLFVGQVPKDVTEGELRPLFEPFGEIVCLNVLRTQRGQGPSAGCAFVEYRKWAQAERAMETHNGVTKLAGSEMPLVVKFADAKRVEMSNSSSGTGALMSGSGFIGSNGGGNSPDISRSSAGWDYGHLAATYSVPMSHAYGGLVHSFPYGGYDMVGGYSMPMYPPVGQFSPMSPSLYAPNGSSHPPPNKPRNSHPHSDALRGGSMAPSHSIRTGGPRPNGNSVAFDPKVSVTAAVPPMTNGSLNPVAELAATCGLSALSSLTSNQLLAMQAAAASGQPLLSTLPLTLALPLASAVNPGLPEACVQSVPLPDLAATTGGMNGLGVRANNSSTPSLKTASAQLSPGAPNLIGNQEVAAVTADLLAGAGGSMGALSLSDRPNLAGTTAGMQAVGLSTTPVTNGAPSLANTNVQLAALNAEATHALEAALAGRASTLSADAAAGLLAAQQVLQQAEQQAVAGGGGGGGGSGLSQLSALERPSTATAASGDAVVAAANAAAANALSCATGSALVDSLGASAGLVSGYLGNLPALGDPSTMAAASELLPDTGATMQGAPGSGTDAAAAAAGQQQWAGGSAEGQQCGLDHASQHFKLFVGQVPMEAMEQDLWALFSPIGEILELYVLRNNQTGRSRGCAFVTYASRMLAQQAITQLNGRQVGRGAQRQLVVKFADRVPM